MRSFFFIAALLSAAQLVSCGPEVEPPGDAPLSPPAEVVAVDPSVDLGVVLPSGVDPSESRPPPPPFDR